MLIPAAITSTSCTPKNRSFGFVSSCCEFFSRVIGSAVVDELSKSVWMFPPQSDCVWGASVRLLTVPDEAAELEKTLPGFRRDSALTSVGLHQKLQMDDVLNGE